MGNVERVVKTRLGHREHAETKSRLASMEPADSP